MTLRPLAGLRVVEVGSAVCVAFAARLLADLGADVIKLEPPEGDPLRQQGPFLEGDGRQRSSALHAYLNHGKRCELLDPTAATLHARAGEADLLLVAADARQRLGCLGEPANADRPAVLIATAFGLVGPRQGWAGSEYVAQHSGGYAYHQACPVADPATVAPVGCADREAALLVGLAMANAALTTTLRPRDGEPAPFIDCSAEDVFAYMLVDPLADYHRGAQPPDRRRAPGQGVTIAGGLVWFLPCADGAILVSPREDHQWQRWAELMGCPAWASDPELTGSREIRTRNARDLQRRMAEWSVGQKAREIALKAQSARVACFPVSTAGDLIRNPQLAARRFFNRLVARGEGSDLLMPGLPFAMRSIKGAELPRGTTLPMPAAHPPAGPMPWLQRGSAGKADSPRSATSTDALPLRGVRVVDFSWVMAGPMATKMLGALGAEIVKIESTTRPEFAYREAWFAVINNNKRSCTLDITRPEAQVMIRDLVAGSDIVVENFSARVMAKNGLTYDDLVKVNPGIIFVSASGLGRTGPERDLLAYGSLLQAYSGRVSLIGRLNAELEAMGVMPAWTDPVTSLWETLAVLAALRHRQRTGEGAFIDLSMLEATVALLPDAVLRAGLSAREQQAAENGSATEIGAAPSGCFRCRGVDDWLAVSVRGDAEWQSLCRAIGAGPLAQLADLATAPGRLAHKGRLNSVVAEWCRGLAAGEAEARLQAQDVPAARVRSIHDLVDDPHMAARGCFRKLDDGTWTTTLPWRHQDGWRGEFRPTPPLGGDNDYVFGELLGLDEDRRRELAAMGVIR
jgi:crotonobetainyl-CoA:carnitine CoA-transferase CaiB-like acyl-CoA transferase